MCLAFASGMLLMLALPPHDVAGLAWIALVPLLVAVSRSDWKEGLLLGLVSGTVTNYGAFFWCLELMQRYSKLGPLSYLFLLATSLYQALPLGVWCGVLRSPRLLRGPEALRWAVAGALYVALEYFHPFIFPWYLANTQHSLPEVLGVVELGGVSALSFLLVGFNLGVAGVIRRQPAGLVLTLLLVLGNLAFTQAREGSLESLRREAPRLRVGLVQTNDWIGESGGARRLHQYQRMTYELVQNTAEPPDLLVWPESAVLSRPAPMTRGPEGRTDSGITLSDYPLDTASIRLSESAPGPSYEEDEALEWELRAVQRGYHTPLLFGTTLVDTDPEAQGAIPGRKPTYNAGMLLNGEGKVLGFAPKVKLMIFGETIPFASTFPSLYKVVPLASALLAGEGPTVLRLGEARLGVMICYEDLLPWFHRDLARQSPQLLVNLTNDAWFGKTGEAEAHLALAKMRAVEGRTFLIRSTSTGVSAVVDPSGRVIGRIEQDQEGTLVREVELLEINTLFERWGNWWAWLCLFLAALLGRPLKKG